MSLILEALRRSEAERRRAAPPSLLGDTAPPRPPQASPWPMALGGLLLGGLLAAAAAWWWGVGRGAPVAEAPPTVVTAAPSPPAYDVPIEPVPAAAYAPPPSPAPITPAPRPAPEAAPPSPAPEIQPLVPAAPVAETTITAPIEPEAVTSPTADTGLGPRDGDLRWSEGVGDALPPLRVSMHVYADDPARRFAIVDGQRRREGETLQPGLTLLEIRRDGLRLGWQGRVLWIPR
ncbi:general secretion pathway protein GspB [Silanimonas sp.]|jgi:general secretion pathway protein B|uniref:general secretion pathway protein GspB n=1 Tax=Silanimonas sp. TaxID=1929290 RepID=UPI0022CC806A|nr:general secretion pathway protein GspB [Silanimonas sp.]MCZ8115226.1 general secretion pathway protein GspB [Silanimonas sp.]